MDLLYNTFAREEEEEFWEDLPLFDAVDEVFKALASKSRVEEGIKLLETLKELFFVLFESILLLNDAKGMAGLKAHEFFSSFMHQKGIIRDKELRKIEGVIEELNVPLRKFYERNRWKYKFLEAWR